MFHLKCIFQDVNLKWTFLSINTYEQGTEQRTGALERWTWLPAPLIGCVVRLPQPWDVDASPNRII